jgi:acetylornithine deacetylase/succinyl-diaminopimelate desuccinylase-like protein
MTTAGPDPIELLQALVRIPSVNPSGDPGTAEVGETACARYIAQRLEDGGARVELREILPGRPNVLGCFPADRPGKPKLLLCPHTDTVSVAGMTIDPFAAERRQGRVYGRGATDTKGTISAMLCALWELRAELARLQHEIWFVGLMDEEAGNSGATAAAAEFQGADFALVGEPTQCDIVNTHKGVTWLLVTTKGHSAHAATPQLGENAIYKMADVLRCVRDELAPSLAQHRDPVLGVPTASAGVVRGGSKVNIVPEACTLELDLRTVPAQDQAKLVEEVRARLRGAVADVQVELIRKHQPLYTSPAHPCVQALIAAGGRCVGAPWFCDGSLLASAGGIPSVAAGPGDIAQAHTADEWLAEEDLRRGVRFYADFLRRV